MLTALTGLFASLFSWFGTTVIGAVNMILHEAPDQFMAAAHAGFAAALKEHQAGKPVGDVLTAAIQAAEVSFGGALSADLTGLLTFFVHQTAP